MYMYMVIYTDMDLKPDTGSAAEVLSGLQPNAGQTQQKQYCNIQHWCKLLTCLGTHAKKNFA